MSLHVQVDFIKMQFYLSKIFILLLLQQLASAQNHINVKNGGSPNKESSHREEKGKIASSLFKDEYIIVIIYI